MKTLQFSVTIKAPKEKVWNVLWNDDTYPKWTSAFSEGSHAETDWKEGSRILFLSPGGEGMFSVIEKSTPNELMSFKHLGMIKDGKEQPPTEESAKWTGSMETYTLKGTNGSTELLVDIDVPEDQHEYFNTTFSKALATVQSLAEN